MSYAGNRDSMGIKHVHDCALTLGQLVAPFDGRTSLSAHTGWHSLTATKSRSFEAGAIF
jgi:hypothetical protein